MIFARSSRGGGSGGAITVEFLGGCDGIDSHVGRSKGWTDSAPAFAGRPTVTLIHVVEAPRQRWAATLESHIVVEEVFGELEDSIEGERPQIEWVNSTRVTARADVRYDELLEFLEFDPSEEIYTTETLAEIIVNELQNVPRLGDSVELAIGTLRVENMARSRMTRVALALKPKPVEHENKD